MSVLIKGMKAPRDCYECEFAYTLDGCCHCSLLHDGIVETHMDRRADDCPMVEIPSRHGDLIDRDALPMRDISPDAWYSPMIGCLEDDLDEIPVIVPREEVTQNENSN